MTTLSLDTVSSLLVEIDAGNEPDNFDRRGKIDLLRGEFISNMHLPNFSAFACKCFENSAKDTKEKFSEEYFLNLLSALKFTTGEAVIFLFSLTHSKSLQISLNSSTLLRSKLCLLTGDNDFKEISIDIVISFAQLVLSSESLILELPGNAVRALRSVYEVSVSAPIFHESSIAGVMAALNYGCSASVEIFSKIWRDTNHTINEEDIVEIIILLISKSSFDDLLHSNDTKAGWNLEVIVTVLSTECQGIDWRLVLQKLDNPFFFLRSEKSYQKLSWIFDRLSGSQLPAISLLKLWSNKTAQLSIFTYGLRADTLDFSEIVSSDQQLGSDVKMPNSSSWLCLSLFSVLLELAASGLSIMVLEIFVQAASLFPEYILLGFAQVIDPGTCIRAEILRRTLPLFTGLPGSFPTSHIVMKRLLKVNADLLVLLFRIALKRSSSVEDIVVINNLLDSFDSGVLKRVEEEGVIEEVIGDWCVRADRFDFNLEERLLGLLIRNPNIARSLALFVSNQSSNLRARHSGGCLLSFHSFSIILKVLRFYQNIITAEEMKKMNNLLASYPKSNLIKSGIISASIMDSSDRKESFEADPSIDIESFGIDMSAGQDITQTMAATATDDVEEESNLYFQKIYASEILIPDAIVMLKKFKSSEKSREQEIFRCMVHNLFDEYRFFHNYPEKELEVTARLFGALIQSQLVSSITLGIALRYILEALKKDPEQIVTNEKIFSFGKIALEQFRSRLGEWPQYCSHLVQIPHFGNHCFELFQEAQRAVNSPSSNVNNTAPTPVLSSGSSNYNQTNNNNNNIVAQSQGDSVSAEYPNTSTLNSSMLFYPIGSGPSNASESKQNESPLSDLMADNLDLPNTVDMTLLIDESVSADLDIPIIMPQQESDTLEPAEVILPKNLIVVSPTVQTNKNLPIIEQMLLVNIDVYTGNAPPDGVRDQILFIINNIAKDNFESKTEDLRNAMTREYYNWFANYLVVKRVSTMPNLHPIYLSVLETLDSSDLFNVITDTTYHNATKLLHSSNITTSSSERSLLRNLGIWLGQITLARNKPLLHSRMDLKKLLLWGYESARLIAVCSFVAKIIEGVKESRVFRPPNPWLMAVLGIMRELYDVEDLKMNIKFEVQVLCKNVNIRIEDIPRGSFLSRCKMPVKDSRNPDFTIKASSIPSIQNSPSTSVSTASSVPVASASAATTQPRQVNEEEKQQADALNIANASLLQEQTVIPNLASYVTINQSLTFFSTNPNQRRLVPLAVDRAIREIIQPVVERSVSIANVTTKQLIVKDFYSEANETQLRNGAHLMISNLAGSLALVTCKEPLRISISNHLRTLLTQSNVDQATIEQIVQVCSNDNLELGCILIEKASTEKAIRDVDESLSAAIQARRKARETGQSFVDTSFNDIKYFVDLPEPLKPKAGGLNSAQYLVYETFQRPRNPPQAPATQKESNATTVSNQTQYNSNNTTAMQTAQSSSSQNSLSMSQSLEAYQLIFARLDIALKAVQLQASGREVTISMLGTDHEILGYFRDMIIVTQRTLPSIRSETAMAFCENVFKRLMDSMNTVDILRLEVMIGIIESLRDACGGAKKFVPDVISWLSHYATFSPNDESSRKFHRIVLILLLKGKLVRTQELDVYFASCMDGGRNIVWVEVALLFIRQCLSEGLAATFEFANSFDTVSKMRPANAIVRKQLQKWLSDLRTIAATKEEQKGGSATASRDTAAREHVTALLERWLRVWNSPNDQIFGQYLQLMHQYGVLKTEEAADRFFRLSTELCVEACLKAAQVVNQNQTENGSAPVLTYTVIDALSKLFLLLVRLADKEAGDITVRVNLLNRILNAIARTVIEDHEIKKTSKVAFDQRPYYRLFLNLSQELGIPDFKSEPNPVMIPLLTSYCQVYLALQPSVVPGFAFSWLQLISHRTFMPHLLLVKGQKCWPYMHKLIIALLQFLQPFLKNVQLNDSIRRLYKGTLRVLLVLLHDFPEFLCDFHLSFCDVIPSTCVQLRNLVLSAFPRTMRLPDPFTPNLKVDLLPEISQPPRILTDHMAPLIERGIRQRLDSYISTKQPSDLPALLASIINSTQPVGASFSISLLTSVIVYVGSQAILQLQSKVPLQNSPSMEIFRYFITVFDAEGRYSLFNVMANQLRYPNSHTYYFSCVLLWLFSEAENESIQQQITRVLLERLIVHRPHPWGLLITFIELIKNPRYAFWKRSFTRSAPEIEKVFESVARSCMGPNASSAIQQQQQHINPR